MNNIIQERIDNGKIIIDMPKGIKGYTRAGKWKENFDKIYGVLK